MVAVTLGEATAPESAAHPLEGGSAASKPSASPRPATPRAPTAALSIRRS
jgi:hypothetical protein